MVKKRRIKSGMLWLFCERETPDRMETGDFPQEHLCFAG